MKGNSIPKRVDAKMALVLDEIKLKRIAMGKDNPLKPMKTSRITLAMTRHPNFQKIKWDIIKADLK